MLDSCEASNEKSFLAKYSIEEPKDIFGKECDGAYVDRESDV